MTLQGLTIALSENGVEELAKDVVADEIAGQLAKLAAPRNSFKVKDFSTKEGWGLGTATYQYSGITITLSGGRLTGFNPVYRSISQGSNGTFTLTMEASSFKVSYNWNESYTEIKGSAVSQEGPFKVSQNYGYEVAFASLVITVGLQLSYSTGAWALEITGVTSQPSAPNASIPRLSILNSQEEFGCYQSRINKQTEQAVSTIDFLTVIKKLIDDLGLQISSTGKLTPDIAFEFGTGPSGIDFPADQGLQVGVTGQVLYQGKVFPGGTPPQLPLPAVPTTKHLAYYAAAYEFDALFWAFFEQGLLTETVTPGDVPEDPAILKTNTYRNGPLQALPKKYPNLTMTADLAAAAAPTVMFQMAFDLSDAVLARLKGKLPADVFSELDGMSNQFYLDEPSFYADLVNALGQSATDQWKATIENAARTAALVVEHQAQVVLNVLKGGNTIPVLTFSVAQKDVLSNLALGISASGKTQTLQFGFQIVPDSVETKLLSTTIPSITTDNFGFIWNLALEPRYAKVVATMGQQGLPLPRIPDFDFLFQEAQISIETTDGGYVSVLTDFDYQPAS